MASNRPKMDRAQRAKQFMPFAALKGYEEALRQKEKIIIPPIELSEDVLALLDEQAKQLEIGSMVTVTYYANGEYLQKTGLLSRMDMECRFLQIIDIKIPFDNIISLSGN